MKLRLCATLACAALIFAACSAVDALQGTALTSAESALVGTWRYTGPGLVKTYALGADRTCTFTSDSQIYGIETTDYVWEAEGSILTFYTPHAAFLDPVEVDGYSLLTATTLQIEGEQYQKQ